MALKAGYVGIKNRIKWKINKLASMLPANIPEGDKLALNSQIDSIWSANARTGVHNFMLFDPYLTAINNVTPTVRDNGTLRLNIANSNNITWIGISQKGNAPNSDVYKQTLKKGSYKFIVKSSKALSNNIQVGILKPTSQPIISSITSGTNNIVDFSLSEDTTFWCGVRVAEGVTETDFDIQAYIIDASDSVLDFTDFAMTNLELTEAENKHFGDDVTKVFASLDEVNVGLGYGTFSAAISPTGSDFSGEFICFGKDSAKGLALYRYSASKLYLNHYTGSAWTGWVEFSGTAVQTRSLPDDSVPEAEDPEPVTKKKATKTRKESE